jgi:hypothetical protein
MSRKTSTAALDTFRHAPLPTPCRLPRHPAGAATRLDGNRIRRIRTMLPVILRITFSLLLWSLGATSMNIAPPEPRLTYSQSTGCRNSAP